MTILSLFTFQSGNFYGQQGSTDNLDWLKYIVIPLVVAGIAVWGSIRQVKINIITASQVKWIEELRETVSEYLTELNNGLFYYLNHAVDMNNLHQGTNSVQNLNYHKYTDSINSANRITYKIVLFLDSENNQIHRNLEFEISDVNKLIASLMSIGPASAAQIEKCREDVLGKMPIFLDCTRAVIADETSKIRKKKLPFLNWGN